MQTLPDLGVGIVYFPALEPLLKAGSDVIDVLEIEPQHYWIKQPNAPKNAPDQYRLDERAFERIAQWPQQKLVHGVGIPVGGSLSLDYSQLKPFVESIQRLNPAWFSEHLAFLRTCDAKQPLNSDVFNTGFLLPPLQSPETVRTAVANIRNLQAQVGLPFAFENAANYLKPQAGEMPDGEFLANVAEQADCGMLLDMHNLWCNEKNGRQPVREVLASLPLDRIWEVHLAGGDDHEGYWLDAHSGLVPEELLELCVEWFPRFPSLKAVMFEVIPDYLTAKNITTDELHAQMHILKQLWHSRGSNQVTDQATDQAQLEDQMPPENSHHLNLELTHAPVQADYEQALGILVNRRAANDDLQIKMAEDPGIKVLQNLVTSIRAGMLVDLLTLSYRLMVLHLGEPKVRQLMETYWDKYLPEPFAAEEIKRFAAFVKQQELAIPYLEDVLNYEVASVDYLSTGDQEKVIFSCDPQILLSALHAGHLPDELPNGNYEVAING